MEDDLRRLQWPPPARPDRHHAGRVIVRVELPQQVDPRHVHSIAVGERRVRYLDQGAGQPLLLCHGFMGSLENFHTWGPAFAGSRRVIIPDLPGCGETDAGSGPHDVAAHAAFLREFTTELGLGAHDVGGICLGATVALEYAFRHSELVSRLVLHTPVYSPASLGRQFKRQVRVFTAGPIFGLVASLRRNRFVSDLYKRYLVEGPGVDPYDAQVNFVNQCRADASAARQWLRDGITRDYSNFLQSWPKPALIVVAADDRIVDVQAIRRLGSVMPQATLRVIEAAGHGWTPTLIAAQVEAISAFLR